MVDLLTFLAGWYAGWQRSGRSDLEARFGRSDAAVQTQSAWIDLRGEHRWGQITLWESGATELEVNDVSTMDLVYSQSGVVDSPEDLDDLITVLIERVVADGR